MTLFRESELAAFAGGQIISLARGSVAEAAGLLPGDELLAVNGHSVQDVIDVQFYGAEESVEFAIRRDQDLLQVAARRDYHQTLGIEFAHPTFDTDIRRCNNLCEFCFVLQMAPRFRRTLYIKDDDYRYSFLFGHYVTLTNLKEHDWWRIETMRLSPLYVSVHVTDLERRRLFLRNDSAPDIMPQLQWLADRGIELHTQLVIVPEVNDGPWLEQSLGDLATLYPAVRSVSVVPVGLTKHHKYHLRQNEAREAQQTLDFVESQQKQFKAALGSRFVYASDEWYLLSGRPVPAASAYGDIDLTENGLGMVRRFLDAWQKERQEVAAERQQPDLPLRHRQVILATGTMFAPLLTNLAVEFAGLTGATMHVVPVENIRLGRTISAAGLLMAADVVDALASAAAGDLVVLPRIMFDHPDTISLDDVSPVEIASRLQCPVALADTLGDVWDAMTGRSRVYFRPANGH